MAQNANLSQHKFTLNNGSGQIPALGFGTSLSDNTKTREAVKAAVEGGFRHLDAKLAALATKVTSGSNE